MRTLDGEQVNGIWLRRWPHKAKGFWSCCARANTTKSKILLQLMGGGFVFLVIAAAVVGSIIASSNRTIGDKAACATVILGNRITNGYSGHNWGSLDKSRTSYSRFAHEAAGYLSTLTQYFPTETVNISDAITNYQAAMDNLYYLNAFYLHFCLNMRYKNYFKYGFQISDVN